MEIIDEMAKLGTEGYVFPGPKPKKPLSTMAMPMLLRRMKANVTVHGFHSTFRDWASETTGFSHEVCEMALAHTIGNTAEAASRPGDMFEKRRKLMETGTGNCSKAADGHVFPLHGHPQGCRTPDNPGRANSPHTPHTSRRE